MKKSKFRNFIFIVLLVILPPALTRLQSCDEEKIEIVCKEISFASYKSIGNVSTCNCEESLIVSTSDASMSSVLHKSVIATVTKIEGLYIDGASVKFIPHGIHFFFPILRVLWIRSCGLLSVNKENLKPFGDFLEYLRLEENEITSIDADLFEYNTNLKFIDLSYNPLRFIAVEFIENLMKMKNTARVLLHFAICVNQEFYTSTLEKPSTFIREKQNCNNLTAKRITENLIKEKKSKCFIENNASLATQIPGFSKTIFSHFNLFACLLFCSLTSVYLQVLEI